MFLKTIDGDWALKLISVVSDYYATSTSQKQIMPIRCNFTEKIP